jgi:hypothetical protein
MFTFQVIFMPLSLVIESYIQESRLLHQLFLIFRVALKEL